MGRYFVLLECRLGDLQSITSLLFSSSRTAKGWELRRETSCPGLWGDKQPRQDRKKCSREDGFFPDLSTKGILGQRLSFRKQQGNRTHSAFCQWGEQPFQNWSKFLTLNKRKCHLRLWWSWAGASERVFWFGLSHWVDRKSSSVAQLFLV